MLGLVKTLSAESGQSHYVARSPGPLHRALGSTVGERVGEYWVLPCLWFLYGKNITSLMVTKKDLNN